MDVKRKVGVLQDGRDRAASLTKDAAAQAGASKPDQNATKAAAAALDATQPQVTSTRQDRDDASLLLWKEWAEQSLGQAMVSQPTHEELFYSNKNLKTLEKKCADLAARAQRRLAVSAALRSPAAGGNGGESMAAIASGRPASARSAGSPGGTNMFGREAQWAARERRRSAAYEAVRMAGACDRTGSLASPLDATTSSASQTSIPPQLKSRAMLTTLLSSTIKADSPASKVSGAFNRHAQLEYTDQQQQPPASLGSVTRVGLPQSSSVRSTALGRSWSASSAPQGSPSMRQRGRQPPGGPTAEEMLMMQQEMDDLRAQLDEAKHAVETKNEMEAQLREALDVLRARVAAQGARELEHQRRLQQHARLEPIFDRLAECFTFRTPEEVVARLEFLEDEKLGSFDELIRAHEEVATLQQQLEAALAKVEVTRTTVTSQHLEAAGRLQARNAELQGELESLQYLNRKLEARQQQLVSLQGAVLDLWGRCQQDADFVTANTDPITNTGATAGTSKATSSAPGAAGNTQHGTEGSTRPPSQDGSTTQATTGTQQPAATASTEGEAVGATAGDLEAILSLIKELLVAKTPVQATRHYQNMQQVAHRVWSQHFTHKRSLRGKIVETFEALSNLAEIMAARIRTSTDQLERSKAEQQNLREDLDKLQVQKRALQVALQRRDTLVRNMSGVPRSQRGDTAAAYQQILLQDAASWGPDPSRRLMSQPSSRGTSPLPRSHSARHIRAPSPTSMPRRPSSARSAAPLPPQPPPPPPNPIARGTLAAAQAAAAHSNILARSISFGRPASAPATRQPSSRSHHQGQWVVQPLPTHRVADTPEGSHWQSLQEVPARPQSASNKGALFHSAAATHAPSADVRASYESFVGFSSQAVDVAQVPQHPVQVLEDGRHSQVQAQPRWVAPRRADIEAGFLSRLERAAGPRGGAVTMVC